MSLAPRVVVSAGVLRSRAPRTPSMPTREPELRRALGTPSAIAITVGSVIGSGIFLKPLAVAQALPSEPAVYLVWALLGLTCLCGAFAYGELGCLMPEAGGQYAFLREAWGRFPAFLFGWCFFLVINTGTIAALSVAFGEILAELWGLGEAARFGLVGGMILWLALVNHWGVQWGALMQNVSAGAKVLALGALVVAGVVAAPSGATAQVAGAAVPLQVGGLVAAAVAIFWAYEGWHMLAFNAAELRRPERSLPLGFIGGMVVLIALYLAVNWTYFRVIDITEMRTFTDLAAVPNTAVQRIFGDWAGQGLALLMALSVLGAANTNFLSSPRAFYAMAHDGLLPRALTKVHRRFQTPTIAIWVQAAWAGVLVFVLERFEDITEYVIFAALIFYGLAVLGVMRLRRRWPDRPRAYRCTGYPFTPLVFVAVVGFVTVTMLGTPASQRNALYGLGILALGVPVYFMSAGRAARKVGPPSV